MSGVRALIVLTLVAAAVGGVTAAVFVAARSTPPSLPPTRVRVPDGGEAASTAEGRPSPVADDAGEPSEAPAPGLTRRIDDPDPAVRHALALELLRRGPDALAQSRALRPRTPAGRDLQGRLTAALGKMLLLRRAQDYGKLPEHIRLRLDLDAFASVVPENLLVDERLAYWEREVAAVRHRLERGVADPAEESLALLELALARREAGRLSADAYTARAEELLPGIDAWVARRRVDPAEAPSELDDLERQVRRLR